MILFTLVSLLASSTPRHLVPVAGDVFIVTKGGDNVKLGLVSVRFIPERDAAKVLPDLVKDESGRWWKLSRESARAEIERNLAKMKLLGDQADADRYAELFKGDGANYDVYQHRETAREKVRADEAEIAKFDDIVRRVNQDLPATASGASLVSRLPSGLKIAKTDADGRFLTSLSSGKYLVAATAERQVGNTHEIYSWTVWLRVTPANASDRLFLSNDNLFGSGCDSCAVSAYGDGSPPTEEHKE